MHCSVVCQQALYYSPCAGAAAHDLVRLLDDKLAARLALVIVLALGLVIAHVHELGVVVAVCYPRSNGWQTHGDRDDQVTANSCANILKAMGRGY